jgi:glutamate N-acetyltransferase/amino-acid N-acetyltransferase
MIIHFIDSLSGITAPKGFKASGVRCGLKQQGPDLALIYSDVPCPAAAMFTTNRLAAAPVLLSREHAENGQAQAVLINSGCANACTGERGLADARETISLTASRLGIPESDILIASTGVIGKHLPMEKLRIGIDPACDNLSYNGGSDAALAIMTTDTRPKSIAVEFTLGNKTCRIGGMAKGSGMIQPYLATMISTLTSDVAISPELLKEALAESVSESFNILTIDGETSTNDCVFLLANGLSGNERIETRDEDYTVFLTALKQITLALTRELALDGEGATKLLQVNVQGASDSAKARIAAKAVANSLLVKTAVFGKDPNWGRVISAVGASGVQLDPNAVEIRFAGLTVAQNGGAVTFDEAAMHDALEGREIRIDIQLGIGTGSAAVYSCDLSYDYVRINADYHT